MFKTLTPELERIASNVQYWYKCKDSADRDHVEPEQEVGRGRGEEQDIVSR